MFDLKQTETFRKWRTQLEDERARALIASRLDRLAYGHAGDTEPVGKGSANYESTSAPATAFIFRGRAKRLANQWNE
jgi:putative addiction module killer protein